MSEDAEKSWFDSLSEILSKPLPGTEQGTSRPAEKPVVFSDTDDDDSLLDQITDILSKPLPGTESLPQGQSPAAESNAAPPQERENPGETAVKDAEQADADPVSTTAAVGADWMQREYERFNAHQERNRQAFAESQRQEQERFFAYQRQQMQQFMHSQERERQVLKQHQQARFQNWRQDIQRNYMTPPGAMPPGMMPPPPPPPPWWRKPRPPGRRK